MINRCKKQWNVKMDNRKLILIFLLILIPILILSLHIISNEIQSDLFMIEGQDVITRKFFGIEFSLYALYDVMLCLIIFISIFCILLFLMGSKKRVKKH